MAGGPENYYASNDMDSLAAAFKNLAADVGTEVEEEEYYDLTAQRQFVIKASDATYPAVTGFQINVGGTVYTSGLAEDAKVFSETIDVQIPEDYTGDVVISREGYVTYSMPIALVSNYNTVTMHPDNNGEPFVQQLLCQPDSEKQSFRSCFDHVTIQEASLTDSADETQRFYVDINWNRHTAGEVWLQQGNTRLDLTDGEYCDIPVSRTFKPDGGSIYLHFASAEGFSGSTSTNISISPAKNSLPVDLGESMVIPKDDVSKMHIFGDRKLEVDFSEWTEVPISFTVTPDGTISGTIGLRDEDGNALGSTVSAKEKSLRETFKKLEKNKGMSKKKFNDMLKELTEDAVPKNSKFGLEGKVWLVGYFSGKLNENNQLEIKEVDAYLIGEGSVSYTLPFTMPLIHIPAYFQAQLKAAIQGDLTLHQKEGTLMPMPDIKIDSNITLSLGGGVGVEGVLSGGVQGDGTAGLEIMLMDSDENKAYLEAGFSLVGSIIGIKGKWELYHTPKYYFYKDGKFTWTKSKAAEATAMLFTMTPEPAHASVFYSSGKSVISDEIRYSLLKSDTTMFSEPQLVSFDDGTRLVVWRDVVSGRTGVDAYGAYYSYYNGNQWSSPKLVEDDGTNDYGLSMTKVNGEAYILWHDYDIAFGADLEEVDVAAEHVDISIARFDRSSLTVSDHTEFSAGGYDHQPQLNISGSELQLAWKSGTLEEEALYMAVSQNGVTWSEPAAADVSWYTDGSQQIPSDYSGAALMNLGSVKNVTNGDLRAIVYRSEDLSGTQNIFAVYHSEDGWGLPIQLTSFSDGTYVDAFGADMTEDSLELSLNITYAIGKSDLAYQEIILGTDLAVIRADYDHFTLTPGKSSVFYARVTNEGPWTEDMLKLRLLDAQGNVLKTQLADGSIASGETVRLEMNYVIPEDGSLNELTLVVLPVHTTDVDESNNQMSLDIHYSDISVEEMQAHVTEEMTLVTARIVNRGSEALPAGSYSLHYGTPDGPVVSSGTIPATISGAVETLTLTLEPLTCGELLYLKVAEYENENLVSNNQGIVTIQGLAPQVKPQITLDREYMTLTVGQTVQLTASCSPDSARDSLVWTVEPIEGDAVITVDATGTVHAAASGSAYVLATVTNGDMEATARCRVDVAAPVQIDGVQLGSTKLTSELYSTDYAKLQIALLLPQNYPVTSDDLLVANSPAAMAALTEDNGISVVNARFVNENLAKWFDLVALDDRNFILVPTEAALKTPGSVKKSYTSAVAVNVRGQEYVTQEQLTLTVKKTQPKLKATVPAFNSFYSQQSRDIRITGATVTGISCDTLPEWLTLTDGVLTLTKDAPQKKASAKITLSVQTTEWAIPAKVTLSVKNSYKAPGLKLSSSKVTLSADAANSCGVSLTLKAKSKKDTLSGLNVTGLSAPKGFTVESFDPVTGSFILKATDGVTPGKISMDVSFGNTANTLSLPLTVKTAAVKLNASTKAVTLNTGGDSAVIRITATPADYLPVSPTIRLLSNDNQDKLSSRELDIRYETGELTVSTTETTPEDAQYTLYISAGGSQETAIKINTVGEDPSMKMKAAGKIDLSFPDRSAAVTITFQNHSGGNVRDIAWSVSESKGKTVLNADVTSWFSLEKTGNSLLVACVEPTSVNVKNTYTLTLQLTLSDGRICQGTVKLPVKQTAVSVKLSSSRITLNNTISDKAVIGVTCPTKGYAFTQPVWQLMDETGKVSAAGALDVQWVDGNLHVAVNNSTKFDTSYKLLVRAAEGAKASTLTVTIPAEKKSAITASLKAKGRLDVVRDGTTLILTPSYGNCSAAVREETLEIYSSADNYAESIKDSFVITRNDQGQFLLTRAKGAELNHKLKYKAELTADFGGVTVKATASFKLKMGSAKLAVKADSLTLFAKDRNSRVDFCFAAKDTALNEAVRVEIKEAKYQNILELYSYGNGQYAIGFKNGNVPKNLKSLTLNVFLDGNETSNANAAIKLKLKLIP